MLYHGLPAMLALCLMATVTQVDAQARRNIVFDNDWHFLKGDTSGAEKEAFNDGAWRKVNVPHDWSIEGPYDKDNATARGGGYLPAGVGWYRKTFTVEEGADKQQHFIQFDGVMANSDVWMNGVHLGKRPFGYSTFRYDITPHLHTGKGKANVIAVRADNTIQPASRYYTGAGIYRHVHLIAVNPVHFAQWGTVITTPVATATAATVQVAAEVVNTGNKAGDYVVEVTLLDPAGKVVKAVSVKQAMAAGATVTVIQKLELTQPVLWDIEKPALYTAVTRILSGKTVVDDESLPFGVRTARFDAATGFWLNDKNYKIKGVCLHHDGGAVGAAVPLGVWEQRLTLLKQAGVNGIRTSHNPVAPEFLDLCDRMGFVVMDETFDTWMDAKHNGEKGYNLYWADWWKQDTRDMVMRDRNHPCIVIYSVGNEIHDNLDSPAGFKKYKDQQDLVHSLDATRPVTMALFRPANSKVYTNGFAETMDVVGQNYRENELVAAHEAHPDWKVIGTENTHVLNMWLALRDKPYMSGQFLWTGFDYLGEADWPETTNNQGLFDRAGNWKPQGLQRESWWSDKPVVHIVRKSDNAGAGYWIANWTPTDFDTYDNAKVQVYSNCEEVELFLNGKSLGALPKPANDAPREWDVTFEKGTIKAVGKNKGKEVATESFTSAGVPAKIVVTTSRTTLANNRDAVAFVTAVVTDANGVPCANADNRISFRVTGAAAVTAVDNGNVISHELYQASTLPAFQGKAIALVQAAKGSGKVTVDAVAEGMEKGTVTIELVP